MKKLIASLMLITSAGANYGQVATPGTGIKWNMDSLALRFPAAVIQNGNDFAVSEAITFIERDTFFLDNAVNVYFDSIATMEFVKSVILIRPDDNVIFSAADTASGFARIRLDGVETAIFDRFYLTHSSGISLISSKAALLNSRLEHTKHRGSNPSGAVSLLTSDIRIDSSMFTESARSALTVGATGLAGVHITSSTFSHNDYENGNYPQINIGSANDSGVVIRNCTIEGKYARSGAIGFLNITDADYKIRIENNTLKNNRYGVAVTGRGISGYILNNLIDSNNIEGEPMLGGSGLNFQGDSSIAVIASGNTISNNLWGVTIQPAASSSPKISLGRSSPLDPIDIGENVFLRNGNNDTLYAVFNNGSDSLWAQNNYWDFSTADAIENTIVHHPDDSTLGWVIYEPFLQIVGINPVSAQPVAYAAIYPNPVSANAPVVYIRSGRKIEHARLSDLQGRQVHSKLEQAASSGLSLNLSGLQPGIYFLQLYSDGQVQNQKVVLR